MLSHAERAFVCIVASCPLPPSQVDPNFNIYEVALPWAVQRALSPSTAAAKDTLRASVLTEENKFEWERVETLIEQQKAQEVRRARASSNPVVVAAPPLTEQRSRPCAVAARRAHRHQGRVPRRGHCAQQPHVSRACAAREPLLIPWSSLRL